MSVCCGLSVCTDGEREKEKERNPRRVNERGKGRKREDGLPAEGSSFEFRAPASSADDAATQWPRMEEEAVVRMKKLMIRMMLEQWACVPLLLLTKSQCSKSPEGGNRMSGKKSCVFS